MMRSIDCPAAALQNSHSVKRSARAPQRPDRYIDFPFQARLQRTCCAIDRIHDLDDGVVCLRQISACRTCRRTACAAPTRTSTRPSSKSARTAVIQISVEVRSVALGAVSADATDIVTLRSSSPQQLETAACGGDICGEQDWQARHGDDSCPVIGCVRRGLIKLLQRNGFSVSRTGIDTGAFQAQSSRSEGLLAAVLSHNEAANLRPESAPTASSKRCICIARGYSVWPASSSTSRISRDPGF